MPDVLFSLLTSLVLIFIQTAAVMALCYWVIETTLLAEITNLAFKWKIGKAHWYPPTEGLPTFKLYTRKDWTDWTERVPFPPLLAHLLNCRLCLSAHASLWTGLLLAGNYPSWTLWLAAWAASAGLAIRWMQHKA